MTDRPHSVDKCRNTRDEYGSCGGVARVAQPTARSIRLMSRCTRERLTHSVNLIDTDGQIDQKANSTDQLDHVISHSQVVASYAAGAIIENALNEIGTVGFEKRKSC